MKPKVQGWQSDEPTVVDKGGFVLLLEDRLLKSYVKRKGRVLFAATHLHVSCKNGQVGRDFLK